MPPGGLHEAQPEYKYSACPATYAGGFLGLSINTPAAVSLHQVVWLSNASFLSFNILFIYLFIYASISMARSVPSFGKKPRSKLQKAHTAAVQPQGTQAAATVRGHARGDQNPVIQPPDTNNITPKTARIRVLEAENGILQEAFDETKRRLHNVGRQLKRAKEAKLTLKSTLKALQHLPELPKKSGSSASKGKSQQSVVGSNPVLSPPSATLPVPIIEPDNPTLPPATSTSSPRRVIATSASEPSTGNLKLLQQIAQLRRDKDSLRKRLGRSYSTNAKYLEKSMKNAKLWAAESFVLKTTRGVLTEKTRSLIRALVELGVPFNNVLKVIKTSMKAAGVKVVGTFSRQSVHRVVLEGGVYSQLQVADEALRTKGELTR